MSRWKVEAGFWWVAMQVDEQGHEIPDTAKRFPTHAEAIAYADRKVRAREVVLPGPDWLTRHGVRLDVDRHRTSVKANSLKYGIYIDIPTQDLRPFVLALLAHAERMEG